jgi:environmental stress-induced protein Ves
MSASILKSLFAASAAVVLGSAMSACAKGELSPGFGSTADDAGDLGVETGAPASYTLGGTVTGLKGAGMTLESNGQTVVIKASDKTFAFQNKLAKGEVYKVSAKTQPTMPSQTCVVTAGEGTVTSDVSSVAIACTTTTFAISVNVTGLLGTGLVLRNNDGDDLTVAGPSPATVSFSKKIESGAAYSVTVQTMPTSPRQVCAVSGGTGTVVSGDIKTVTVNCETTYTVGGTVSGLAGSGLVLQNNGVGDINVNANGSFAFAKSETTGAAYAITVKAQPTNAWQTCAVANSTGVVAAANVTTASVVCTSNPYTIRGSITGLSGAGAKLQNNGGDTLTLAPGATSFTFPVQVRSGGTYAVSLLTQPLSPSQACILGAASGTVQGTDVSSVTLTCTTQSLSLGGTVTGLVGSPLVLQNSNGDTVAITGNGGFAFPISIASGSMYAVTVKTQPSAGQVQSCVVANATGTMGAAPVTNVQVSCAASLSTVGGSVQGLVGAGLTLKMNGTASLAVNPNTPSVVPFTFPSAIATGAPYAVTIAGQPTTYGQTCVITSGGTQRLLPMFKLVAAHFRA